MVRRRMGVRVVSGVLCFLMIFEWPVLADPVVGSNWANHRAVGGNFNAMGWSSVLYQPLPGALHVGELLAQPDGSLAKAIDWGERIGGVSWSAGRRRAVVGDFTGDGQDDLLFQGEPGLASAVFTPSPHGKHYTEVPQGPFTAIGGLGMATHHLVVGDFTGAGRDDLFMQALEPGGRDGVVLSGPHGGFRALAGSFDGGELGLGWSRVASSIVAGDFSGTGRDDLLVRARGSRGSATCCELVAPGPDGMPARIVQSWAGDWQGIDWTPTAHVAVVGDLTGDGRAALLLQPVGPSGHVDLLLADRQGRLGPVASSWPVIQAGVNWSAESYQLVPDQATGPAGGGSVLMVPRLMGLPYRRAFFGPTGKLLSVERITAPAGPYGPGQPGSAEPAPGSVGGDFAGTGSSAGQALSGGGMGEARAITPSATRTSSASSTSTSTPAVGTLPGHFSVTPTGAATYTIPLAVAPGVNGLEPHLSLVYQSGTGGSQIGLGWTLGGFSVIARCPDTVDAEGYAASPRDAASDAYCLDGAHLIPDSGETNGASGTEYHTTIASFRKITSAGGSSTTGPGSFTVLTKSGLTETYGNSANSAVGSPPAIWLLHEVTDRFQNFIEYHYVQNSTLGSYRVSSIDYGNAGGTTVGQIDFNYASLTAYNWILSCSTGECYVQHSMLSSIEVYSGGSLLWTYQLNQTLPPASADGTGRPTLASVKLCDAGLACEPATSFQYAPLATGWNAGGAVPIAANVAAMHFGDFMGHGRTDFAFVSPPVSTGNWCLESSAGGTDWVEHCSTVAAGIGSQATPIDWQDDGTDGLLIPTATGFTIAAWNGSRFAPVLTRYWPSFAGSDNEPEPVAVDLTGSGDPDIVFKYNNQIWYFANDNGVIAQNPTNTGFATTEEASLEPFIYNHSSATALFDGPEGCTTITPDDIPTGNTSSATCAGTVGALVWNHADGGLVHEIMPYQGEIDFLDLTGDGLDDEITNLGGQWEVFLNRGGSFDETPDVQQAPAGTVAAGPGDWAVADAYDSSRQDLLVPYKDGDWHALSWGGYDGTEILLNDLSTGLSDAGLYPSLSHGAAASVDVTGAGLGDLAWESAQSTSGETWTLTPHTAPVNGANGDLLTGITNGLGVSLTVGYGSINTAAAPVYTSTPACSSTDPEVSPLAAPIYVVKSLSTDPVAGSTVTTSYRYGGACVDRGGRGFLGFSTETVTNSLGYQTITHYAMGFPYTGIATASTQTGPGTGTSSKLLLASTQSTLAEETTGTQSIFPYVSESLQEGDSLATGDPDRSVTTQTTYNEWGDATAITTTVTNLVTGETHTTSTANTFTEGTQDWCLGRLTASTVTEQGSGEGAMSRATDYAYGSGQACVLDSETFEPDVPAVSWTKTFAHDAEGNVTSVTESGPSFATRTTTTGYDADGRFVVSTTDPLGLTTAYAVNDLGEKTAITGPNGETETRSYDGFGRLAGTTGPWPGESSTVAYAWCNGGCADARGAYAVTTTTAGGPTVTTEHDHHGRAIFAERQVFGGSTVGGATYYDAFGRPYLTSAPFFLGSTPCWIWHGYDARGRVDETVSAADGAECMVATPPGPGASPGGYGDVVSIARSAGQTAIDDNGRTTVTVKGVLGHVLSVTDPLGGVTANQYDAEGDLVAKKTPVGAVTTYAYDAAGHRIGLASASNGSWSYSYDALGELLGQTDPTGNTVTESYDLDGDLVSRTVTGGTTGTSTTSTWTYGTAAPDAGRLVEVSNGADYTRSLAYTPQGAVTAETTTLDGVSYTVTRSYDALGQLVSMTDPPVPDPSIYAVKPTARASASPTSLTSAGTVTLSAAGSTDPDGGSLGYTWTEQSGPVTVSINGSESENATVSLEANGVYVFQVVVGDGYTSDSATVSVTVAIPPGMPGTPIVSPDPSDTGEYTVTWGAVTNVSSYNLEQSVNGGSLSQVWSGSGTNWSPSGAEPNGSYGYALEGCNNVGCSAPGGEVTETVDQTPTAPGTPVMKDPSGKTPGATYSINWSAPGYGAVTAYNLEESPDSSFPGTDTTTTTVSAPPVFETFGSNGATHWYRVQGCHDRYCGGWSGALEVIDPTGSGGGCPSCKPQSPTAGPASGSTGTGSSPSGTSSSGSTASGPAGSGTPASATTAASPATASPATASPDTTPPPSGGWQLTVSYVYDSIGDLVEVYGPDETHPYWTLAGVDARGQVTEALEGGGADTVTSAYDAATGEKLGTGVEDGSTWIFHQEDVYDVWGERVGREDRVTGEDESYRYDADSRLTAG